MTCRARIHRLAFAALCLAALGASLPAASLGAQAPGGAKKKGDGAATAPSRFFDDSAPLTVTLTADVRELRRDRARGPQWRAAMLAYAGEGGRVVQVPARVQVRGHWRLGHCDFPPLRLEVRAPTARGTAFEGLGEPKLVSWCRDTDAYEQYVLQELQLYRVFALLSPLAYRVRPLRVRYVDAGRPDPIATRWAFLVEPPKSMAARAGATLLKEKGAGPDDVDARQMAIVALFEYLIGNTDWSVSALHNVELLARGGGDFLPVPYDFDFSGVVNAPYALPDSTLGLRSVRERRYRGYCVPRPALDSAVALFRERRGAIRALYDDEVGRLLEPGARARTLAYFDDAWRVLDAPASVEREIVQNCRAQ